MEGIDGAEKMKTLMSRLRSCPPDKVGEDKIRFIRDYLDETITDTATGSKSGTNLPKSNVLFYEMENGNKVIVRPSGTEPKIKFYMGVKGTSLEDAQTKVDKLTADLKAIL